MFHSRIRAVNGPDKPSPRNAAPDLITAPEPGARRAPRTTPGRAAALLAPAAAGALAALALSATAQEPKPKPTWQYPEFQRRAAFEAGADADPCVMVRVPIEKDPGERLVAHDAAGRPVACRKILATDDALWALVAVRKQRPGPDGFLYYDAAADATASPPDTPSQPLDDDAPIQAVAYRLRGHAIPDTWPKMLFMYEHAGRAAKDIRLASFAELAKIRSDEDEETRKKYIYTQYLLHLRTYALFPTNGIYRLAINCRNAGFLLLDGDPVAEWPGEHPHGRWVAGAPIPVKAGIHELQVFNGTLGTPTVLLGWARPGSDAIVPMPRTAFVAAALTDNVRPERKDRTLHPSFNYTIGEAYAFREQPAVFVPVTVTNTTADWLTDSMQCRWQFNGKRLANGAGVRHIFVGLKRHTVALQVRDALGYAAGCERTLDCRLAQPTQHPFFADLTSLPAVCYPSDKIIPHLDYSGSVPEDVSLHVAWRITLDNGRTIDGDRNIVPRVDSQRLPIVTARAGDLAEIAWHVDHADVEIAAGRVRFLSAPFAALPARVEGDALYAADGTRLVLLPHEEGGGHDQFPIDTARRNGTIVCIDDSLAVEGLPGQETHMPYYRLLERDLTRAASGTRIRYVALPDWRNVETAYAPLVKLVAAARAADKADIAIVSIGLQEALCTDDTAAFERHAAALADLLGETLGCSVVWATPPPYPPDRNAFRPYAVAIRRVADARRMPVAGLYTAFQGADETDALFAGNNMALSIKGHDLTAKAIARAIGVPVNGKGGK